MTVAEQLRTLEESLLTTAVRQNAEHVASLLADEFLEFGRSGRVYSKEDIIAFLQAEGPVRLTMSDFACRTVAEGVALVTYRSARVSDDGEVIAALRSSVWVFRAERWQIVFHQGTSTET